MSSLCSDRLPGAAYPSRSPSSVHWQPSFELHSLSVWRFSGGIQAGHRSPPQACSTIWRGWAWNGQNYTLIDNTKSQGSLGSHCLWYTMFTVKILSSQNFLQNYLQIILNWKQKIILMKYISASHGIYSTTAKAKVVREAKLSFKNNFNWSRPILKWPILSLLIYFCPFQKSIQMLKVIHLVLGAGIRGHNL